MNVEVHVPEVQLRSYHQGQRRFGCGLTVAGLVLTVLGGAAAELIFGPLGVFAFAGFMALVIGPIFAWQSHQALRVRGDLWVEIDAEGFRHRHGADAWPVRRAVQAVIVEGTHVDVLAVGVPMLSVVMPLQREEKEALLAELSAIGVILTRPERSPLKLAGGVLAIVLGVGAFLILWRLLVLALFGLMMLGIHVVAPDNPTVQIGLFFGLAFGVGLPLLIWRLVSRWRA